MNSFLLSFGKFPRPKWYHMWEPSGQSSWVWFLFLSTKYPSVLMYNILPLLFIDVLKGSLVDLFSKVLLKLQTLWGCIKEKSFCELPNNLFSSVPPCWTEMSTKYGIYTMGGKWEVVTDWSLRREKTCCYTILSWFSRPSWWPRLTRDIYRLYKVE